MKVALSFSSVGILCAWDSPLSLTRLLFRHALYRLNVELRVSRQVENPNPVHKWLWKDMNIGIINETKKGYSVVISTNNYNYSNFFILINTVSQSLKSGQCCYTQNISDTFLSGLEGKTVSSRDTESHCEVGTTADMKLSTACHQDSTLCPADSSIFDPRRETKIFHCTISHSLIQCIID